MSEPLRTGPGRPRGSQEPTSPFAAAFAERLRMLRAAAGMTLEDLARESELAIQTLYQYEAGQRSPKFAAVCQIARGLDVSLCEFDDLRLKEISSGKARNSS